MESINNTGKPNLPEKTPSSQPNQQNKIKNNVRRLLSQSNRITKQEISRLAEHNPETDLFKALLLTATTGVGAAYDSVTIEVMNQGADETDGLGQDSDTQNDRRGPVGLGIQVAKNWLSSDKFDENIQWQEAAQNSGYYVTGGALGAHYGPNNVGFSSLRALKHLYHIAQEYSSGSRQMETKSLIEGLTELKESLSSINAADNTFLNDQVDLLISKVKTLTKIGTCNDLIDVSNDLQRIAETVVAFSILAGGGDGGTTAFIASIFKTVLATANLHWDNQITKHSDEYNREALEELKVNFEKDTTPVVSELFETHSLNELKDTVKAALCNRTLPHIKTEDRLTKLVPSVAKPKITHVDIIEIEHEKGITQNDIEIDFIDSLPVEKTKEDIQESKIELKFDTPQLKQESNYNKYLRLEQSLKSDNKLDKINEKIEKADTQKIFDWTDRLAVYEAVRLLEPEQFETVIENLINCRLSLVTTSGTNLNFISNDNKGINQTTFDKMHDELSLYKPYRNMRLSQKDTKKGLNELKKALLNKQRKSLLEGAIKQIGFPKSSSPPPPTDRESYREIIKGINEEAINYAEKMYFKGISKKISILEEALTLKPGDQELKKKLQDLKEKSTKVPSEAFYDALTQFDFEVKKENARTEPVSQKLTLHSSYKKFASMYGIPLTMANRMLKEHASSKLGKKLEGLLGSEAIKSLQNYNSDVEFIKRSLIGTKLPIDTEHDSFLESVLALRKRQLNGPEHRQELAEIKSLEESINKVKKNIALKYKLNEFRLSGTNRLTEDSEQKTTIFSKNYQTIKNAIDEYNQTLRGTLNPESFIQEVSERYHLSV